ncbi:hypothetical protein OG713_13010 [Streptomyces sp. NBC_00723]|uniref:hypothetical protein n=1 Tax=Streptomyces sp. NBC_00723 TaxID=2903673 RepID=UPI0038680B3D
MQRVLSGDHVGFSGGKTCYGPVTGMAEHHHRGPALATALGDLGQVGAAPTAFRRAVALLVEVDDWYRVAETHLDVATLVAAVGRDGDAAAAWTAAAGAYDRAGAPDAADCRRRSADGTGRRTGRQTGRHDDSRR